MTTPAVLQVEKHRVCSDYRTLVLPRPATTTGRRNHTARWDHVLGSLGVEPLARVRAVLRPAQFYRSSSFWQLATSSSLLRP